MIGGNAEGRTGQVGIMNIPSARRGPSFAAHAFICWAGEWSCEGAERVISGAASAGLDFVEIPPLDPETVELTAALGSSVLTGCLYTHIGTLTGCLPEPGELRAVARALKSTARRAAEGGVELSIEAVNRYETYLINLASQVSDLLDEIDEPNVFAHLDTYHMNIDEKGFYEPILSLGPRLKYIHLSESDRGTPGTGNVHGDEIFRGLKGASYDGALVIEAFAACNEAIIGATLLWRDVVGDPDALVTGGLAFLRAKGTEHELFEQPPG